MNPKEYKSSIPVNANQAQSLGYTWYIVGVLMLAYLFSYIDRSILSLLVGPIRSDLQLSDTQLSLLHGFAFALFYAILGFPIGRAADRYHRVGIIVTGISFWSIMTAACGLAKSFPQLFLARMGVGIGEAALNPCAYSIITDSFPRRLLARALSTYVMGTYMGFGVAFVIGGLVVEAITQTPVIQLPVLGQIHTWQAAFFYVGLPGLIVALLILLTVREPKRFGRLSAAPDSTGVPLTEVVKFIKQNRRTLVCHLAGFSFIGILVNGLALWTPSFFNRTYGWEVADAGIRYGLVLLCCGPLGIFLGGWLADRIDRNAARGGSFISATVFSALGILPACFSPLPTSPEMALILIVGLVLATSAPWGVAVSAIQQISPNEMRGQISALYLFVVNLIGIGLGPTAVALITDQVFGSDTALRYSMAIVGGGSAVLGTVILFFGLGAFRESSQRALLWKQYE